MRGKPPTKTKLLRSSKVSCKSVSSSKKGYNIPKRIEKETVDISVLHRPINTSVLGLRHVLKLFESGTEEMREILSNECSVIYECKICRNLFRSIANFLSHKRSFCSTKFTEFDMSTANDEVMEQTYLPGCDKGNTLSSRTTTRHDIISLLDSLFVKETKVDRTGKGSENATVLKEIKTNSAALYKDNKENLEEIGYEKEVFPTLDPEERLVETVESTEEPKTVPPPAQISKTCFVCPCCKKYLPSIWSVHKHLHKEHHKTTDQVRKLRPLIQKKEVSADDVDSSKTPPMKSVEEEPYNLDRAWMKELEDNMELQRCLGCGRKFDRRVALLSHSATCQKRASVLQKRASVLQKRKRSTQKLDIDKRTGIQASMYYEKRGEPVSHESSHLQPILAASSLSSDTSLACPLQASSSLSNSQLPDNDITDIVSRYRKDLEVHDTYRRSEVKLLQLHNVAVEEVEGSLTDWLVPTSFGSIQDCICPVIQSYPSSSSSLMD